MTDQADVADAVKEDNANETSLGVTANAGANYVGIVHGDVSTSYSAKNTTDQLVNYELRRKMRKVGVQMQHIGTQMSWQVFVGDPGSGLGLGELTQSSRHPT